MAKTKSLYYPTTKNIPLHGGSFQITNFTILDTSLNDDFVNTFNAPGWTADVGNANVTNVTGTGSAPMRLDVDGATGVATYYINGDFTVSGPLAISCGFVFDDKGNTLSGVNDVFVLRALKPADDENIQIKVQIDEVGVVNQIELTYRDSAAGSNTVVTTPYTDRTGQLRVVLANSRLAIFDEKTQKELFDVAYLLDWNPAFDLGVQAPNAAGNVWSTIFRPFTFMPVVTGIKDKRAGEVPWCQSYNSSVAYFHSRPGFPGGPFPLTLNGIGTAHASTDSAQTLSVLQAFPREDSVKFMASNVTRLYDDFGGILACRTFALRDDDNVGDASVPMQCFNDGTALDASAAFTRVMKTGTLADTRKVSETVVDSGGVTYQEAFRFDRINHDEDFDLSIDPGELGTKSIKYMRCLVMSNHDRCYYGVIYDPTFSTAASTELEVTGTNTEAFTIFTIDSDGVETTTGITGIFDGTSDQLLPIGSLDVDRYVLRGDTGSTFFSGTIYGDGVSGDRIETSRSGGIVSTGDVNEIYFDIIKPKGELFVMYHDVSANTITKTLRGTEDVSIRKNNLSAVETSDGKVAIIYEQGLADFGAFDNIDNDHRLYYRIFEPGVGLSATESYIELPASVQSLAVYTEGVPNYTIHAFDVTKTADAYNIVFSARLIVDNFQYHKRDNTLGSFVMRTIPFLSDGFYALSFPLDDFDFQEVDYIIESYEISKVDQVSFKRLFEYRAPDSSGAGFNIVRAEIDYISAEYDVDKDLVVVSTIDRRHRCPMVFAGLDTEYKEISLPFHFKTAQYLYEDATWTSFDYFGLETYHAQFGYDGFIYGVGIKPEETEFNVEIGIMDSALYYADRDFYIERGPEFSNTGTTKEDGSELRFKDVFDVYRPPYRFEAFPFLNNYGSSVGFFTATMTRSNQYQIITLGGAFVTFLTVFQNGEYDEFAFATSEEDLWIPEIGEDNASDWQDDLIIGNVTFSPQIATVNNTGSVAAVDRAFFGKNLTSGNTPVRTKIDKEKAADIGYKFHARVKFGRGVDGFNITLVPSREQFFSAIAVFDDGVGLPGVEARFRVLDDDLFCEIWDPDTSAFVTVKTFLAYITQPEIIDYYIVVKVVSDIVNHKARVTWVWKTRSTNIEDQSTDSYFSSYTAEVEMAKTFGKTEVKPGTYLRVFSAAWNSASESTENNRAVVYQMGWNVLDIQDGMIFENPKVALEFLDGKLRGSSWRRMNDDNLLNKDLDSADYIPAYGFRILNANNNNTVSPFLHWPNGIEYRFSGIGLKLNDQWEIGRETIDNLSFLTSDRLHGIWYSSNDDSDLHLWADANDSNFDEFYINSLIVLGCNVPQVTLVGRDNLIDAWTELEVLDLTYYDLDGITHAKNNDQNVATIANGNFVDSGFISPVHYYQETGDRIGKIFDVDGGDLFIQLANTAVTYADTTATVFRDRGVLILDTPVQFRFIGIKVPITDTFDGYFKIHTLDFGFITDIPLTENHALDSGKSYELKSKVFYGYDEQGFGVVDMPRTKVSFELEYRILDGLTVSKFRSLIDKISQSRKPIWVINDYETDHSQVYLCLIDNAVNHGIVIDEDGEKFYKLTISLRSVQ